MICKYVKDFSDCSLQVSCGSYPPVDFGTSGSSGSITTSDIEPATSFSSSLNDPNSMTQKVYKSNSYILSKIIFHPSRMLQCQHR